MPTVTGSESSIALVRAEYLLPFIDLLRSAGTPVERELRRARLPLLIEELPDNYLSTDLVFRFLQNCAGREGIGNIGFAAGWRLSYDDLGTELKTALCQAPTLKTAIEVFSRLVSLEDSEFRCDLQAHGDSLRIRIRQYVPQGFDSRIAEWQNLKAIIELVRQYQSPDWLPQTIGLTAPQAPAASEREQLGNVRILSAQPDTFVEIPRSLLARPRATALALHEHTASACSCSVDLNRFGDDLTSRLRAALMPYLISGHPSIELAAELTGLSVRKLQRRLAGACTSYSALLETLRFEQALHLLRHTDMKVLDIALSLGYTDASNFSRAVRRISGVSPRELRSAGISEIH